MNYIKFFNEISMGDIPEVGGKNASLGEMIQNLRNKNIEVPDGFAITVNGYWHYIAENKLQEKIEEQLAALHYTHENSVREHAQNIRKLIIEAQLPTDLQKEIKEAYKQLSRRYSKTNCDVAVRSSATAEDLPSASFAGQQDTYLNIKGITDLYSAYKKAIASLFTERAIIYRHEQHIESSKVGISIGVQKMIRSDKASSGVMFTLDTDSGFKNAVTINASYGLGETIVGGMVNPDEFCVFKPTLKEHYKPIIKKLLGSKTVRTVYTGTSENPTKTIPVSKKLQKKFCLTDEEVLDLARQAIIIENYYSEQQGTWTPMDIEWAQDGYDKKLYIVQARPETVYSQQKNSEHYVRYSLEKTLHNKVVLTGQSIGKKIASGPVRVINNPHDIKDFSDGDIIVTSMTDPDWVPLMKRAAGIITDLGGRTCHAAIVARELGIPAIVGTETATRTLKSGEIVTLDCSSGSTGMVYSGKISFNQETIAKTELPKSPVSVMVNLADPDRAFETSFLPVAGVGLARLEFIITNVIKIHPMAVAQFAHLKSKKLKKQIEAIATGYANPEEFFVNVLAQSIGMIAAAFYPKPVIVRLTDFKSNEYHDLLGGELFEPDEENPMLGFRGAVRYTSEKFAPEFTLESRALKKAREEMGLSNIIIMIPFVRTVPEAKRTIDILAEHKIIRGHNKLELYMMVEIPSNVILIEEFAKLFDGFSIGSNDLTQLTLGVDRDSGLLTKFFDERDPAVKKMMAMAIAGAHKEHKHIGICGQAPSDFPEIADFLIEHNIDSLSLNPDSVIPFLLRLKK